MRQEENQPMESESIGARLHKARLKKKSTIEQVYKDIKIHPRILTALEEDRYDEFLNPTYIKAFLKSYCRYLELDANRILADYDTLVKEAPRPTLNIKQEEKPKVFTSIDWKRYIESGKKWLLPILGGVLVVFLSVSIVTVTSRAIKKVRGIKIFEAKPTVAKKPQDPSIIKPLSIPQNESLTLIVKTKGDVWLEVRCDGKVVFKSILKKGSVEAYKADDKFQLWTGKGEYLDLVLNGNPLGSPGGGVLKKIILTREGLSIDKK